MHVSFFLFQLYMYLLCWIVARASAKKEKMIFVCIYMYISSKSAMQSWLYGYIVIYSYVEQSWLYGYRHYCMAITYTQSFDIVMQSWLSSVNMCIYAWIFFSVSIIHVSFFLYTCLFFFVYMYRFYVSI